MDPIIIIITQEYRISNPPLLRGSWLHLKLGLLVLILNKCNANPAQLHVYVTVITQRVASRL